MTRQEVRAVQVRLKRLGFNPGPSDGILGDKTKRAIKQFQLRNGLKVDGIVGRQTREELWPDRIPERDSNAAMSPSGTHWFPVQHDVQKLFGKPGGPQCTAGKVSLPFPFRLAWDTDTEIYRFSCHEEVAWAFELLFTRAYEHYGEVEMSNLGLDLFGGCYNFRAMRGGRRMSMHSWGIAIDLDPAKNRLKWNHNKAQFASEEYDEFHRIAEDLGLVNLGRARDFDWMHWQAARL